MILPCWLLFHRWHPTRIQGRASTCDFRLDFCLTCGAYRMGAWSEPVRRGGYHRVTVEDASRFFRAGAQGELQALLDAWHDREICGNPTRAIGHAPPLCCATPDWLKVCLEIGRVGACDIDLERCRSCGAWRLGTFHPKDSPERCLVDSARISDVDARFMQVEKDRALLREFLVSKNWYGLSD